MTAPSLTSRFQVVERPLAHPGKCAVCGSTDRPCVDFGFDVEDYGTVYFCLDCLTEVADVIGLVPEQRVRDAELETGQSVSDWLTSRDLKVVTNEQLAVLTANLTSLSTALVPVVFGHLDNVDEPGGTNGGTDAPASEGSTEGDTPSSGENSNPSRSRRSARVPANSSNGLDLGI